MVKIVLKQVAGIDDEWDEVKFKKDEQVLTYFEGHMSVPHHFCVKDVYNVLCFINKVIFLFFSSVQGADKEILGLSYGRLRNRLRSMTMEKSTYFNVLCRNRADIIFAYCSPSCRGEDFAVLKRIILSFGK